MPQKHRGRKNKSKQNGSEWKELFSKEEQLRIEANMNMMVEKFHCQNISFNPSPPIGDVKTAVFRYKYGERNGCFDLLNDEKNFERMITATFNDKTRECPICVNTCSSCSLVSCNTCSGRYCGTCYAKIFLQNEGEVICPFCRDKIGSRMPPPFLELGLQQIKSKICRCRDISLN